MTDLAACCRTPHSFAIGNWFFPNGTAVPNFVFQINNQPPLTMWEFYRNRGQSVVRMIRRRGGVDGIYRCEIPVSAGPLVYQNIYIGVYATNSGECCMYIYGNLQLFLHLLSHCLGSPFIVKGSTESPHTKCFGIFSYLLRISLHVKMVLWK